MYNTESLTTEPLFYKGNVFCRQQLSFISINNRYYNFWRNNRMSTSKGIITIDFGDIETVPQKIRQSKKAFLTTFILVATSSFAWTFGVKVDPRCLKKILYFLNQQWIDENRYFVSSLHIRRKDFRFICLNN